MDTAQMIHLMPFNFLTGSSAPIGAVEVCGVASAFSFDAWVVLRAAGSDDWIELVAFVSLSKLASEARSDVGAEGEFSMVFFSHGFLHLCVEKKSYIFLLLTFQSPSNGFKVPRAALCGGGGLMRS